ncbi:MAG: hypothetical protein LUQ61_02215 [Methanoregulaceae archaeon]|nr:hypothetical protein [Methanoregulaceae archaeon]
MEWIARRQPILKFLSSREKAADGGSRAVHTTGDVSPLIRFRSPHPDYGSKDDP